MIAVTSREEWDYTLQEERESPTPTVFRLRSLAVKDRAAARPRGPPPPDSGGVPAAASRETFRPLPFSFPAP